MSTKQLTQLSTNWKRLRETLAVSTTPAVSGSKKSAVVGHGKGTGQLRRGDRRRLKQRRMAAVSSYASVAALNADAPKTTTAAPAKAAVETRVVALDCEYVGVGSDGADDRLARASLVDGAGRCLLDKFVRVDERVTDFRTPVSGIRPAHIRNGEPFDAVRLEVMALLDGKLLVGHALHNDLRVLQLSHPKAQTRDTANYAPFRQLIGGNKRPALRHLAHAVLGIQIQQGEHDSVVDARVALDMYKLHRKQWEARMSKRKRTKR